MASADEDVSKDFYDRSKTELIRQREVFKYASSILSNIVVHDDEARDSSATRTASVNTTLTAFAQLCACQTGTARSFMSLFDESYQYVVAEATPTLPLVPGIPHEDLLFCGNAFPRHHCRFESALFNPNEIPAGSRNGLPDIPIVVIPDLTTDGRCNVHLNSCMFSEPEVPMGFYASAPIQTATGINIGVICVMHPQPIITWSDAQSQVLRNISRSIMSYLESNLTSAHSRSERMNRGIFTFMEETFDVEGSSRRPKAADFADLAVSGDSPDSVSNSSRGRQSMPSQKPAVVPLDSNTGFIQPTRIIELDNDHLMGYAASQGSSKRPDPMKHSFSDLALEARSEASRKNTTTNLIFTNAAKTIRQATDTEGCLFLDAVPRGFGTLKSPLAEVPIGPAPCSSSTSSDDGSDASSGSRKGLSARVLGFSTSERHGVDVHEQITRHRAVAEKLLGTLVRRYPQGKLFTFHSTHGLHPTDPSEEDRLRQLWTLQDHSHPIRSVPKRQHLKSQGKSWTRQSEGRDILRIFPGARSVAFMPVWDPRNNRWYAGGFIYSRQPLRTFTVEGELSYIRVFSILAMTASLRCELLQDGRAKFEALNSMSHELRSPLHGIILGTELLADTDLSVSQRGIVHTLEACGRTLVDTFDHLLDHAKVNNFQTTRPLVARGISQEMSDGVEVSLMTLQSKVQLDMLTEEVMDSIFLGFNFQYTSTALIKKLHRAQDLDVAANLYLHNLRAREELGLSHSSETAQVAFADVLVLFDADPEDSWIFDTQSGAIRRIIMNLFGNALRYTQHGIIKVLLRQESHKKGDFRRLRQVTITVSDTGCGFGKDLLRNELSQPFSRHNASASESGLGLNLVRHITAKLHGRMSVKSQAGIGTSISVTLPLSIPPSVAVERGRHLDDTLFLRQQLQLSGLRICLLGFNGIMAMVDGEDHDSFSTVGDMCRKWLGLEVLPTSSETRHADPDFVLASEDALDKRCKDSTLFKLPWVVVTVNALVAHQRSAQREAHAGTVEFISQPIGPRKLAKVMLMVFERWTAQQAGRMASPELPSASGIPATVIKSDTKQQDQGLPPSSTPLVRLSGSDDSGIQLTALPLERTTPRPNLLKPIPTKNPSLGFLLVEDNPINLRMLSTYMTKLELSFYTATNGLEAVETYKQNPSGCRCILTDVSMPLMDGFEATKQIRAYEKASGIAPATIIALTGLASSESQKEAFTSGMNLFLTKPVKLKELEEILKSRGLL